MKPSRPFIEYKGCEIYHSYKGAQALTWWYELTPHHQADIGLDSDPKLSHADQLANCKTVIQRAIDDGFDFKTAIGKAPKGFIATVRSRLKWF